MKTIILTLALTAAALTAHGAPHIEWPGIVMQGLPATVSVEADSSSAPVAVYVDGRALTLNRDGRRCTATFETAGPQATISVLTGSDTSSRTMHTVPLWMSVLPPLISIIMALLTREVYSSLFAGLAFGASVVQWSRGAGIAMAAGKGVLAAADTYTIDALTDSDHASIIVFSMLIGGMVALITANGGMKGVVGLLMRRARSRRSGMLTTWLMGVLIFFDDYTNTLVVGYTMRPVADRLRIAREKLAYIVDSTTAPVAAIAFITTWIGAELSYIGEGLQYTDIDQTPYMVFVSSLKYSFYPILTLAFVIIVIVSRRDFGPMLRYERQAAAGLADRHSQHHTPPAEAQAMQPVVEHGRWANAIVPVAVVTLGTMAGLVYTGYDADVWQSATTGTADKLSATIGAADSFAALLWASLAGLLTAAALTTGQRIMRLGETLQTIVGGFKSMLGALMVLVLAWALSALTKELHTAHFVIDLLARSSTPPALVPAITFGLSALIAFSTGTSWGTMAIIYPLMLPAAWETCVAAHLDAAQSAAVFHHTVACVLAGAVWGDHCSPISDTTILSSLSCSCPHISHVRTQMPYAATVGAVALTVCTLPAGLGVPPWAAMCAGAATLWAIVRIVGKTVDEPNKTI